MHVDEWIDRFEIPKDEIYASFFLMLHRMDAVSKMKWDSIISKYKLFCTYNDKRYRVVGASRLGDVWLTRDFNSTQYTDRVDVSKCSSWNDKP